MKATQRLLLASTSPRRRQLLQQIGYEFDTASPEVDETEYPDESPATYVQRLAIAKAHAGWQRYLPGAEPACWWVIGSDTTVEIDGQILGKPENAQAAHAMLTKLAGREHRVYTGVCVLECGETGIAPASSISASSDGDIHASTELESASHGLKEYTCVVGASVKLADMTAQQIEKYWQTGEPADKAGSYGIQGIGSVFVESVQGSYSAVVGLPLAETEALLTQAGLDVWQWRKNA